MTLEIDWSQIALRLALTAGCCALIGFNREEHRMVAGLRTTLLVGLAAAIAMIQVNLLLGLSGRAGNSFVMLDLMRLPLGILSGMGFIGAGAVLRRDNMVLGVTTAATLWFVTVMGLCFGGGQIWLGLCAAGLGYGILAGLKRIEQRCRAHHRALLILGGKGEHPGLNAAPRITEIIREAGYRINVSSVKLGEANNLVELKYELHWYGRLAEKSPPDFLARLTAEFQFAGLEWQVIV